MTRDGRTDAPDDAELLRLAQRDATAFRALYDRHAVRVHDFLLRRTNDPRSAFELTAETFAQAWLSRTRFRDQAGGSAAPWLFAIARHVLLASVRKHALEQTACRRLGLELPGSAAEPEERWLDGLNEALAELPEGQREAIRLRVEDDLEYDRVAASLGTTPQAARVRVHRGLAALRNRLSDSPRSTR
jgi:RNA polymerase sigma factor (sigma-70 family)